MHGRYLGGVTTITIRHVPQDVRVELALRAARHGHSLQEYLLRELIRISSVPTLEDWLARTRAHAEASGATFTADEIVSMIREDRDR